jgi:CRP-like cAMP-binding protein
MTQSRDDMRRRLAAAFRQSAPVEDAAIDAITELATTRSYKPHEWLLQGGDHAKDGALITSGLVRELYVGEDGTEHTRSFVAEGGLTGSLLDLLSGEPSVTWIEAIEPTNVIAWPFKQLDELTARFPGLQIAARKHVEALYVLKTRREYEMLALTAAERCRRWVARHAKIDARVSRRHLASYLGITPEHLSRLRHS